MVSSCLPVFLSSEITFNLLICLIPIALLLFALLGTYLYSDQEVLNHIGRYFENSFPSLDPTIMENILRIIRDRKIVGILGIGGLIWTSTWVFSSLRTALNIVFKVEKGRNIVKGKAIDLFMILLAGIFLLLSMVFTSLITIIPKYHFRSFPEMSVIFRFVLKYPIPFLFTFWMFFLIYKIIPIRKFTSKLLYKHPFLPVFCGRLRSKYLHGMSYILEDSR
jgi:membrane protein